ncbi:hypothetical protein LIER_19823 [Lithospermum erythrorhizon]|uniref:Uncharacterized protein n=1 Tax=Lithospermum erythrorhizon TaxID=34254 RepID=A0AAV3QJ71_LITER
MNGPRPLKKIIREERDSALAGKDKAVKRSDDLLSYQEKLICDHVASEAKLKSEEERATLDSEKFKAELSEAQSLLEDCLAEKENLTSRLVLAENSAASAVEDFKGSSEYVELLKGDTVTLLRDFCQKVSSDFPGISSHFQEYTSGLAEEYVVDLFDDIPDNEDIRAEEEDSEAFEGGENL